MCFHCRSYRLATIVVCGLTKIILQAAIYFCLQRQSAEKHCRTSIAIPEHNPYPKNFRKKLYVRDSRLAGFHRQVIESFGTRQAMGAVLEWDEASAWAQI